MNQSKIEIEIGGVDPKDYPDFCDAYIERAWHADGTEMTEAECEQYEADHPEVVNEEAFFSLVGE